MFLLVLIKHLLFWCTCSDTNSDQDADNVSRHSAWQSINSNAYFSQGLVQFWRGKNSPNQLRRKATEGMNTLSLPPKKNKIKQQIYHILQSLSTAKQKLLLWNMQSLQGSLTILFVTACLPTRPHLRHFFACYALFLYFPDFHIETLFQNTVKNSPSGMPGFSVILICRSGTTGSPSALPISAGR